MLAIPYLGIDGHPVALRFRCIEDHDCKELGHGKYQSITGASARLFNVRSAHEADDHIAITEGEIDAMSLVQAGIPAVSVGGASGWKRHYPRVLAGIPDVMVFADNDDAGKRFASEVSMSLENGARIVALPEAKDPNEYLQRFGTSALADAALREDN